MHVEEKNIRFSPIAGRSESKIDKKWNFIAFQDQIPDQNKQKTSLLSRTNSFWSLQ